MTINRSYATARIMFNDLRSQYYDAETEGKFDIETFTEYHKLTYRELIPVLLAGYAERHLSDLENFIDKMEFKDEANPTELEVSLVKEILEKIKRKRAKIEMHFLDFETQLNQLRPNRIKKK